jgi:hypothetical protein
MPLKYISFYSCLQLFLSQRRNFLIIIVSYNETGKYLTFCVRVWSALSLQTLI